jgi:hypothetical protein
MLRQTLGTTRRGRAEIPSPFELRDQPATVAPDERTRVTVVEPRRRC